ncbi:PIG-P-domain-containing protein [Favolaschia claudopus]|uniref:PIG-P-domain-containing protein n=1 Tax=Favolaschia claudopus TaxID=2862362 RepID=A0AAW0D0M0_9AGAR
MEDNPTSPLSPVAQFPPIPFPEYRNRAPEFYGFVAWTSTSFAYFAYLLWAFLPDEYIQWLGITWYPSREWAVLFPAWSIVVVLLTYFAYFALALYGTPAFSDMSSIIDSRAHLPPINPERNPYLQYADPATVPDLYDIPIGLVNRVCYGSPPNRAAD